MTFKREDGYIVLKNKDVFIEDDDTSLNILDQYLHSKEELYNYFGYVEDWVKIPIVDTRDMYWYLSVETTILNNMVEVLSIGSTITYPVSIKGGYTIGIPNTAFNNEEFVELCQGALDLSPTEEVMVESQHGNVIFYDDEENIVDAINDGDSGDWYQDEIYTQRFLPKWIYYGENYTMVSCDTRMDGNKFLRIFDNSKRIFKEE